VKVVVLIERPWPAAPNHSSRIMGRTSSELVRRTEPCEGLVVIRTSRTSWRSSPTSVGTRSPALGM
jgi:hypothetical protein